MELIDTHCHLDMDNFDTDREDVLTRAKEAEVVQLVAIGIDPPSSAKAIDLAERYENIFSTVGHHPHDAETLTDEDLIRLNKMARHDKVVGFGEIGLDFFRNISPREVQLKRFDDLLQIALDVKKPLIIHDRDAHEEIFNHLKAADAGRIGGVIHCFSGDYALARRFVDLGFVISVTGVITFPKSDILRDVAARLPLDVLMVETDAPYLAPVPYRGKRNEPAFVRFAAAEISRIKNLPIEDVAAATTATARRLFNLPPVSNCHEDA